MQRGAERELEMHVKDERIVCSNLKGGADVLVGRKPALEKQNAEGCRGSELKNHAIRGFRGFMEFYSLRVRVNINLDEYFPSRNCQGDLNCLVGRLCAFFRRLINRDAIATGFLCSIQRLVSGAY